MKYKYYFFIILVFIILYYLCVFHYNKQVYYFVMTYILKPFSNYRNRYFIKNFDNLISPFFVGNIDRYQKQNTRININRSVKNEYSILDTSVCKNLMEDLKKNDVSKKTIESLLKQIIPYIHLDGKLLNTEDFIFVDSLNIPGNYFQSFHTDVEWGTFCESNGFQVWILLEEDEKIKPRGNMFLLETPYVNPGETLFIKDNDVDIIENSSGIFQSKILKSFNNLKELNPKISYLNAKIGEVFLMNPCLYHCSDPIVSNTSRRALNIRFIYKPDQKLKICNKDNKYSKLLFMKHDITCEENNCFIRKDNKTMSSQFL